MGNKSTSFPPKTVKDSTFISIDDIAKIGDTVKTDSIKPKKSVVEGKIKYKAEAYTKIDQKKMNVSIHPRLWIYFRILCYVMCR